MIQAGKRVVGKTFVKAFENQFFFFQNTLYVIPLAKSKHDLKWLYIKGNTHRNKKCDRTKATGCNFWYGSLNSRFISSFTFDSSSVLGGKFFVFQLFYQYIDKDPWNDQDMTNTNTVTCFLCSEFSHAWRQCRKPGCPH